MSTLRFPNGAVYTTGEPASKDGQESSDAARERIAKAAYHRRTAELATDQEVRKYHLAKLRELEGTK
jgi:hypothetical protein